MSSKDFPLDKAVLDRSSVFVLLSIDAYISVEPSGGGGNGELAWRFSGFGDAGFTIELFALEDEATAETN